MTKITLLKTAYAPKGYTVESNDPMASFDPSKLSLHLESEQEKGYVKGEILAERMKGKSLNSNVFKHLLDNPKLIPESWKEKVNGYIKYIYFFGTVLRDPHGDRCVLCLYWYDGEWQWNASWLGGDWRANDPSAVLASSPLKSDSKPSSDPLYLVLEARVKELEDWKEHVIKSMNK